MNGHKTKYLYYKESGRSILTIPRAILEAINLNWTHKDNIKIIFKEIDGQKGLFLFKPTQEEE
jgi:hypothetical protein